MQKPRLLAFYLPQYHPIPENDRWWGPGFTEWSFVRRARPLFPGHYQPHEPGELGYYDLRAAETRERQAELAQAYGIDGFVYYHYWFSGTRLLHEPLDAVLREGQPRMPFCICWANENWTRVWDGESDHILMPQSYSSDDDVAHIRFLARVFEDKRYIRIGGRPLVLVYRARRLPNAAAMVECWREEFARLTREQLYVAAVQNQQSERVDPRPWGFDAGVDFQPNFARLGPTYKHARLNGDSGGPISAFDYACTVALNLETPLPQYPLFPCVNVGFDNTPRRGAQACILHGSTPAFYGYQLSRVLDRFSPPSDEENLVFVNAWNEWGEGNHLEPDVRWGRGFLEAQLTVLRAHRTRNAVHV